MFIARSALFAGGSRRITASIIISASTNNYTLNPAAVTGYVAGKTDVELIINSGIIVGSTSTSTAALSVSGFDADDGITITNSGSILGMGGAGGTGGSSNGAGGAGSAGGLALILSNSVSIDNLGYVFGGGGGGGGSRSYYTVASCGKNCNTYAYYGGSGGGGGAGQLGGVAGVRGLYVSNYGSHGSVGTLLAGGAGGTNNIDGGAGGTNGSAGANADNGAGGAAGKAATLNGYVITWVSGNNGTQVKGIVS
jgi:hypothetical protein